MAYKKKVAKYLFHKRKKGKLAYTHFLFEQKALEIEIKLTRNFELNKAFDNNINRRDVALYLTYQMTD